MTTDFYQSKEWAALKKKVYARYGRKCHVTGWTEADGITLSIDHIKPRKKFPKLELVMENMQVMELGLNKIKSDRIMSKSDYRPLRWKFYYLVIRLIKSGLLIAALLLLGYALLYFASPSGYFQSFDSASSIFQAVSSYLREIFASPLFSLASFHAH